ncbi:MAG TPA: hypothetical protein VN761_07940, partial [Candidatus Polarisedimenticolia bacterium]|nr:hypothetical protein [Candidatus Polarisedimenticolia bacterium]
MKTFGAIPLLVAVATLTAAFSPNKTSALSFPEVKDLPVQTNLPDVMTMADGTKVTTLQQWRQRREEMKEILEHYELGHAPPAPGNVTGRDLQSHPVLNGAAKFRLVHLKFGPQEKLGFDIAIFTPNGDGPFPTIINPSFFMTPGVHFTNGAVPVPLISTNNGRPRFNFGAPVDPERAARGFTN